MKEDYLRYLFYQFVASSEFNALVGKEWRKIDTVPSVMDAVITAAFKRYDLESNPVMYRTYLKDIFNQMQRDKVIVEDGDKYAGFYFCFNLDRKNAAIANRVNVGPAHNRISRLGSAVFARALAAILSEDEAAAEGFAPKDEFQFEASSGELAIIEKVNIPASDRIVTLNHNQISELDQPLSEVIDVVEKNNGDPEILGYRERVLGQLRAGRELIKAGTIKSYLLYTVLLTALAEVAVRNKGTVIEATINTLVELLINHVFSGG